MAQFPIIDQVQYVQRERPNQRNILPTAIKNRQLANTFIEQTNPEVLGPVSLPNGSRLTITSTISAAVDPSVRIGSVPYMIVFGEGTSLASLLIIPFDSAVADYTVYPSLPMPSFTGSTFSGSTNSTLVVKTVLANVSGGSKNIMVIVHGRYILSSGSRVEET